VTKYELAADGVNVTWQPAVAAAPFGARPQAGTLNEPDVGDAENVTSPVGLLAPLKAVSVTPTVHVVALPHVTDAGEHDTLVNVESTAGVGAGELTVIADDWPSLVLCVVSPW
jgi:hypothetical protein